MSFERKWVRFKDQLPPEKSKILVYTEEGGVLTEWLNDDCFESRHLTCHRLHWGNWVLQQEDKKKGE